MQLFNLLKQAQEKGPNENEKAVTDGKNKIKRVNHAENREEEFISHNEDKREDGRGFSNQNAHMHNQMQQERIEEVEDEQEQNTFSDQEEQQAFDSDAAGEEDERRQLEREQRREEDSPRRVHRDSKGSSAFANSPNNQVKQSLDSLVQRSFDRGQQSPHRQSQGPACIFAPENVEPQSPVPHHLDESLDRFSPRQIQKNQVPIDIYVDEESPAVVQKSAYFPKTVQNANSKKPSNDYYNDGEQNGDAFHISQTPAATKKFTLQNTTADLQAHPQQNDISGASASSPQQRMKNTMGKQSHRDSQRNYFRKDQENKALVDQMRRTTTDSNHSLLGKNARQEEGVEVTKVYNDMSQHDQNMGGQHEHHDSIHDQSQQLLGKQPNDQNSEDPTDDDENNFANTSQQWHDIKVIQSEHGGSQELVIENLENLADATALIVTRDHQTGNFKIGIQQDPNGNGSDIASNARSHITSTASQNAGSGLKKIKLRGKFGQQQSTGGILPTAATAGGNKYRTISVNSDAAARSTKQSGRSRIAMPQINQTMEPHNKYNTFNNPVVVMQANSAPRNNEDQDGDLESTSGPFRSIKRNRESASDNKRLLDDSRNNKMPALTDYHTANNQQQQQQLLEFRSQIQSAQAEELIRKSRDKHQQMLPSSPQVHMVNNSNSAHHYAVDTTQKEEIAGGLGYVKVVDPTNNLHPSVLQQKDPNDRSDSKMGPTTFPSQALLRKPSEVNKETQQQSQYQKSTHRANSSVHSREQALGAQQFHTPDVKQSSTVSVRLGGQNATGNIGGKTDYMQHQSLSSFGGGGPQHLNQTQQQQQMHQNQFLSLQVKQGKKDFQSLKQNVIGTGNKYQAMHELYHEPYSHHERTPQPLMMHHQGGMDTIQVDVLSEMLPGGVGRGPTIPITEEAHSRASVVSRRSNTDMKGENLVKFFASAKHNEQEESAPVEESKFIALVDKQLSARNIEPILSPPLTGKKAQISVDERKSIQKVINPDKNSIEIRSPSRTDTAFYEGKAVKSTTDVKKQQSVTQKLFDRQLSENAAVDQDNVTNEQKLPSDHNYHTTTEDAGDGYFPQILKYTENAPQESILSRDNYSTSAHPSQISHAPGVGQGRGHPQVKKYFNKKRSSQELNNSGLRQVSNKQGVNTELNSSNPASPKMISPTQSNWKSPKGQSGMSPKQPISIMNQNVARVEKQNPSISKASVLSQSIQGQDEGETTDVNRHQSSGLGHVTEEDRSAALLSPLNKDGSSYNIATSDITAIPPKKKSPKKVAHDNEQQNKSQVPTLDMSNVINKDSHGVIVSPVMKKQASKESLRSSMAGGQFGGNNLRSSQNRMSKLSATQRSKASLQSRRSVHSKKNAVPGSGVRAQSMLPILAGNSNQGGLKSSSRNPMKDAKKSERATTIPMQNSMRSSATRKIKQSPYDQSQQLMVGAAGSVPNHSNTHQGASLMPMKLPSVTSPSVGHHLADQSSRRTNNLIAGGNASMHSSKPMQQQLQQSFPRQVDNQSMLDTMAQNQLNAGMISDGEKPIMKYMEASDAEQVKQPLKYFKGQDLELYYMEKQLKPGVEREIKEGFFEIRKKFGEGQSAGEEVQVYVSHLCLHNYHPIFCKFNLDVVKTILNFSQIIYLNKGQVLYEQGFNDRYLYVILFGKLRLSHHESDNPIGSPLNIGWTVGEEILFKSDRKANGGQRIERCRSLCESCVLGIEKRSLAQIKRTLVEKGQAEEFVKLEVVLRGNYLVKKAWRA